MTKEYSCDLCKKVFKLKNDLIEHKNDKSQCVIINDIKKTDEKNTLINAFRSYLNILRDNEGLTGEKALRNLSYLLILKLLEPQFSNEIDIDNYNYDICFKKNTTI